MKTDQIIALAMDIDRHITANISAVWPGFTAVPFLLYDNKSQVAVGTEWPERYTQLHERLWVAEGFDPQLMGNTSTTYHGIPVAIWDTSTWSEDLSTAEAVSGIAHEMFHAFQQTSMDLPWANELLLPQYPHNTRSVAMVIAENRHLSAMLASPDAVSIRQCLQQVVDLRQQRESAIGAKYLEYDKCCETIEGTAAYVEIRMNALLSGQSPMAVAASYLSMLACNEKLLEHYRHRCYAAGLALCLAADVMWPNWQTEWASSNTTIFDWIRDRLKPSDTDAAIHPADLEAADALLSSYHTKNEQIIHNFTAQSLTSLQGAVQLTNFDPMNITCVGHRCLHQHGGLCFGEHEHMFTTPFLIEFGDNIFDVKRILLPNLTVSQRGERIFIEGIGELNGHTEQTPEGILCLIAP